MIIPDYLKPYEQAVSEHGGSFDATLWVSKEGQQLRFQAFVDLIDFNGASVLDVGCGIGDFAQYLIEKQIQFRSFHGIDAMEAMVQTAISNSYPQCTFETVDIVFHPESLQGYDWITISGTLNAMEQEQATSIIRDSFHVAARGVAFNFLSNQSGRDPKSENLYPARRFDTTQMLKMAFGLTPRIDFTQSYLDGHDATIVMFK